ncbi:MAG: integration host factor subunit beta [Bacteroidia bacterium]|nr:integration host factor subunit beta [Bacteroidia bacterium]MCZ2276398.1 integration host factor subunit beta [Bacteroidia bacterium]
MTKSEIVENISSKTGIERMIVQSVIESFMNEVKDRLSEGENIYLRGFGSFICKKRAQKTGRVISTGQQVIIPEHYFPTFRPAEEFIVRVKENVKQLKPSKEDR